jgi:hypothetical protein
LTGGTLAVDIRLQNVNRSTVTTPPTLTAIVQILVFAHSYLYFKNRTFVLKRASGSDYGSWPYSEYGNPFTSQHFKLFSINQAKILTLQYVCTFVWPKLCIDCAFKITFHCTYVGGLVCVCRVYGQHHWIVLKRLFRKKW